MGNGKGLVLEDGHSTYSSEEVIEVNTWLLRSKLRRPGISPPRDAQRGWPTCRPSESRSLLWGPLWQVFPSLGQLVA